MLFYAALLGQTLTNARTRELAATPAGASIRRVVFDALAKWDTRRVEMIA